MRLQQGTGIGAEAGNVDVEPRGFACLGELGRIEGWQIVAHVSAPVNTGEEVVVVNPSGGFGNQLHGHVGTVNEHGDGVAGPES